ncbi:MAG: Hsp20/alpha crystallin family protein [Eubacteriales bacterium]
MFGLVPFDKRNRGLSSADSRSNEMDLFFDNFLRDTFPPAYFRDAHQMKVDIRETENEYFLDADLPGIKKEQVNMEVNEDQLIISVVEDESKETNSEGYICRERRYGTVSRSFHLSNINADQISATLENGILSVTLPKKETGLPKNRKIDIQ